MVPQMSPCIASFSALTLPPAPTIPYSSEPVPQSDYSFGTMPTAHPQKASPTGSFLQEIQGIKGN